jgi:hypothetical protein
VVGAGIENVYFSFLEFSCLTYGEIEGDGLSYQIVENNIGSTALPDGI